MSCSMNPTGSGFGKKGKRKSTRKGGKKGGKKSHKVSKKVSRKGRKSRKSRKSHKSRKSTVRLSSFGGGYPATLMDFAGPYGGDTAGWGANGMGVSSARAFGKKGR